MKLVLTPRFSLGEYVLDTDRHLEAVTAIRTVAGSDQVEYEYQTGMCGEWQSERDIWSLSDKRESDADLFGVV